MTEWLLLGVVVLLVFLNALFVAAEFSLVTVDRATVEERAQRGDARSAGVLSALRTLSTQLSGAQLGITVTSLVAGYVAEPSLGALLVGPLDAVGLGAAASGVAFTLAFVLVTAFQMVLGELLPKNWAIARPLVVARAVAGAQRGFTALARPLLRVLNGSANALLRAVGVEPREELASARSAQELASLVQRSGEEGTLDSGTARLVTRSLEFGERTAGDVMTPRGRVRFVRADAPVSEVVSRARATGHSRFPVVVDDLDDLVGVVHLKHAVAVPVDRRAATEVRAVVSDALLVPETLPLDPLLVRLRGYGLQLGVVVDEFGGTAGVVTLEDVVEEIVGDISDEHDRPVSQARRLASGAWLLSGLLRPDEIAEITGTALPEHPDYDTVAGLVSHLLGRIPEVGDEARLALPGQEVVLTVRRRDALRVDLVELLVRDEAEGEPGRRAGPDAEPGDPASGSPGGTGRGDPGPHGRGGRADRGGEDRDR
ncbi:HlyC/CorC family transporter [Actinoalloteichus sp. AHMU CJ021]|uniref:Hemolysin, contains CBS domains n=1 Tax=Actinoalloteichus caeruleus DSM 43889 TaxID=1120930 RepID=A0ABT1JM79_ACTCY|nr:hemolysin family protein [Actinoalloteichus caeruleus]AUS79011.1 HlyC/CorC family transporter [Actinoalloteichus sp. AHMU CJ021]MCP2333241.1 Hemolysin, contains CBS domains [Actinoalloteichus caeruleus DSM 43889]